MLIEIHMLQNHAPSNLNRDDTGSPKECMFGGVRRARISSQCLKRSIRNSPVFAQRFKGGNGSGVELATRTRRLPRLIRDRLIKAGVAEDIADVAATKASGFGTKEGKEREDRATAQTMFLTDADVEAVYAVIKQAIDEAGTAKKLEKIKAGDLQAKAELHGWRPRTVDLALFGRMITSGAFQNVEAAMQVAHAISTHKVDHEFDYYTAVDDLQGQDEDDDALGADMIGDTEFNSACYYKYFSVDVDSLVDNLVRPEGHAGEGPQREEAEQLVRQALPAFLRAAAHTSPSGKQNAFAAHNLPEAILVEVRPARTPVSYANAFARPVGVRRGQENLVDDSVAALVQYADTITHKFSLTTAGRCWFTTTDQAMEGTEKAPIRSCETFDALEEELTGSLEDHFEATKETGRG